MLYYQPTDKIACCDMWAIEKDGVWYTYHLQVGTPGSPGDLGYGMSTSLDLMDFVHQEDAFHPRTPWLNRCLYAGDVMWWKDRYYMIFSGCRMGEEPGDSLDAMGIATSDDLIHWHQYEGNPVMENVDDRWYEGSKPGKYTRMLNLRDPHFIRDLCNDEWVYMCFAGGTNDSDNYRSGCIGLCRSQDMIHWEYLPPLFAPKRYTLMEVPRVFKLGDQYILSWLCAPWYGMRSDADIADRCQDGGEIMMHYAVADRPEGPYTLPEDPSLWRGYYCPFVINPVLQDEKLVLMSTMFVWHPDAETGHRAQGGMLPAMPLVYDGRVKALFPEKLMAYYPKRVQREDALPQVPYPQCENHEGVIALQDAACCALPLTGAMDRAVLDVDIDISKGRAGVMMHFDAAQRKGNAVLYDAERDEIELVQIAPKFKMIILNTKERHRALAAHQGRVNLKVVAEKDRTLIFVDGVFRAAYSFPAREAGSFGVLTECAQGTVKVNDWYTMEACE